MAKLVLSMFRVSTATSSGAGGEFVPPAWSDDLERLWAGYGLERAGHLLYGRTNFLFNKGFWSAAETDPNSPAAGIAYAATMNRLPKTVVFDHAVRRSGVERDPGEQRPAGAVGRLKATVTGDVYCFGGAGWRTAWRRSICRMNTG